MNTNIANSIAHKMLEKGFLNEVDYTFAELCQIRDALTILKGYGFADLDLLEEVNKYIELKGQK